LLTTQENLSSDQSGGFELVVTGKMWSILDLNLSGNTFYEQIDATSLGYAGKRSAFSWNASLNCNVHVLSGTMVQVNGNYRSRRLTPQGEVLPNYVVNLGFRQDLIDGRLSLVATVTDIFASLKRTTDLKTDWLAGNSTFTRDSRVIFLGLIYNFGSKLKKEKALQYDDNG
jgi:hypothetical protein